MIGFFPQGVRLIKATGRYRAECNVNGKMKHLGYYSTPEDASEIYKEFKSKHIKSIADLQTNERVRDGLYRHAKLLASLS